MVVRCLIQRASLGKPSLTCSAFSTSVTRNTPNSLPHSFTSSYILKQLPLSKAISERIVNTSFDHINQYHSLLKNGNLYGLPIELVNGRVVRRLSQSGRHSNVRSTLSDLLTRKLGLSAQVRSEAPITLRLNLNPSESIPDISIVKRTNYGEDHPRPSNVLLVVEVLKTSTTKDRKERLNLHAEAGIPEYWIVDISDDNARNWNVRIHKDLQGSHYHYDEVFTHASVSPSAFPNCVVNIKELFDI